MVVLDPRTGRLVSISLSAQPESRTGPAAPRPARPPSAWPSHHQDSRPQDLHLQESHRQEPPDSPAARLRTRREGA